MKGKKAILLSIVTMLLLGGIITGAAVAKNSKTSKFKTDGYVLEINTNPIQTSVNKLAFSSGTKYSTKFPSSYKYKDVAGKTTEVDENSFIHYTEGSVSAMNNGVVIDVADANHGYIDFYQLSSGMVLTNTGKGFEIDNNSQVIPFKELMWSLNEDTALVTSDRLDLLVNDTRIGRSNEYMEVRWVEEGIVQVATESEAWQLFAEDAKIVFSSGNVLNLGSKELSDATGESLVSMSEMDADLASGINIASVSAEDWTPPAFKITTIDGEDGTSGESGEGGESGEAGVSGESGEAGGKGDAGTIGSAGAAGAKGSSANSSSSGTVSNSTLGTIRVSEFELINLTSAELTLAVNDLDTTLTADTGVVEIRDRKTNKTVWSQRFDTMSGDIFAFNKANDKGPIDVLKPNSEYELIVKNDYSITINNTVNSGTKTFVDRVFTTPSEGLTGTVVFVDEDTISVAMEKTSYSDAQSYALAVTIEGETYIYPRTGSLDYNQVTNAVIDLYDLLDLDPDEDSVSDKPYTIEIYSSTEDANNVCWTRSTDPDELFVGEAAVPASVKKSSQVIKGTTLKKKPVVSGVDATLTDNGYYELSTGIVEDVDNAISKYTYTVIDPNGTIVKVIESSKNTVNWYYGDTLMVGNYTVNSEVSYYDNQKTSTLPVETGTICVTSAGQTAVRFYEYKKSGTVLKDEMGTTVAQTDGNDPVSASRIWGDLVIVTNGATIDTTQPITINVSASGESTYVKQNWRVNVNAVQPVPGSYYIPIKLLGLQSDTTYTFTVYGTVENTVSNGSGSTNTTRTNKYIGTASVKTDKMAIPTDIEHDSAAAFVLESLVNSEITDAIVGFKLYKPVRQNSNEAAQYETINSTSTSSRYYEARSTARAVEFSIYSQSRVLLATIVKDLYDTSFFTTYRTQFENIQNTTLEDEYLFKGPLVKSTDGSLGTSTTNGYAILTKQDFLRAGFTEDQLQSSKIIIEASALYDYSYKMEDSIPAYKNNFLNLEAVHYNRTPLNVLTLTSAGSVTGYLNYKFINLGEKAPALIRPANKAITVTPLYNGNNPATDHPDNALDPDTVIGLKAQANYQSTGQETEISYYCFTMDAWNQYNKAPQGETTSDQGGDLILDYENNVRYVVDNNLIKFKAVVKTSDYRGETSGQVPAIYVVIADPNDPDDMAKVTQCRKTDIKYDDDGVEISRSTYYVPIPGGRYPVIYTDEISRGDCYVFGMTLKTMYGVDTVTAEDPQPWVFPYSVEQYNSSQMYFGSTGMQRSEGIEVYREAPKVATYLDHVVMPSSTNNQVSYVWKYIVYDPDDTLAFAKAKTGSSRFVTYAGEDTEILKQIYNQYIRRDLGLESLDPRLLTTSVGAVTTYKESTISSAGKDIQNTLTTYFGLGNSIKTLGTDPTSTSDDRGTVHVFNLTVTDNTYLSFMNFTQNPYKIWIGASCFSGKHTVGDATGNTLYADTRVTDDNSADGYEYFAVPSVSQYYDAILNEGITEPIKARVSTIRGTDGLVISVDNPGDVIKEHLTGIYYEIYEDTGDPTTSITSEHLMQHGFYGFDRSNGATSVSIPVNNVKPGDPILIKLNVVYGTGQIGLNTSQINSDVHTMIKNAHYNESSTARTENPMTSKKYYAFSDQNRLHYLAVIGWNGQLSFTDKAYDSVFEVTKVSNLGDNPNSALYRLNQYNGIRDAQQNREFEILYTDSGSFTENRIMVFEGLAEKEIELIPGEGVTAVEGRNDLIKTNVPEAIPSVKSYGGYYTDSLHERTATLSFTEKVVDTMTAYYRAQSDPSVTWKYRPEVYVRLFYKEDGNDVYLDNSDNRYFDISMNGNTGYRNNPISVDDYNSAADADKWTFKFEDSTDTRIELRIRNLDPNRTYYMDMYCYDDTGALVPFVFGYDTIGDDWNERVRSAWTNGVPKVNIGLTDRAGTIAFEAEFSQINYERQMLQTTYSVSYTGGYQLEYSILDNNNDPVVIPNPNYDPTCTDVLDPAYGPTVTLNMRTIARLMGYGETQPVEYWYYDAITNQPNGADSGHWVRYTFDRYYYIGTSGRPVYFDQTVSSAANTPHEVSFTSVNKFLHMLNSGNYKLGINLKDNYGGTDVVVTQDSRDTESGYQALTPFRVPLRNPINVNARVSFSDVVRNGSVVNATGNISISVNDSGYLLAYKKSNGQIEYGNYDIVLQKLAANSTTWTNINPTSIAPSRTANNTFEHSRNYTIRFAAKEGERYRIKVRGIDLSDPLNQTANIDLYDSETNVNSSVRDKLNAANLSTPVLNNVIGDFDMQTGKFTVTSRNGSNLDKINHIFYTLYYLEEGDGAYHATDNIPITFSSPNYRGDQKIEILLSDMVDLIQEDNSISFYTGDLLGLTVEFYDDTTYLTEQTFTFRYR